MGFLSRALSLSTMSTTFIQMLSNRYLEALLMLMNASAINDPLIQNCLPLISQITMGDSDSLTYFASYITSRTDVIAKLSHVSSSSSNNTPSVCYIFYHVLNEPELSGPTHDFVSRCSNFFRSFLSRAHKSAIGILVLRRATKIHGLFLYVTQCVISVECLCASAIWLRCSLEVASMIGVSIY